VVVAVPAPTTTRWGGRGYSWSGVDLVDGSQDLLSVNALDCKVVEQAGVFRDLSEHCAIDRILGELVLWRGGERRPRSAGQQA
jgi:hypothetical protein